MNLPLFTAWQLSGAALPERLIPDADAAPSFSLPGADTLAEFADLLGFDAAPSAEKNEQPACAPFPLPGLFPLDVDGCVCLFRTLDFSAFRFDRVLLSVDMVCGSGEAYLIPEDKQFAPPKAQKPSPVRLAAFANQPLTLDLTAYIPLSKRCRVEFRFDAARPAGFSGAVSLRLIGSAALKHMELRPQPALQAISLTADVYALREGSYLLRTQLCPPGAPEHAPMPRERTLRLKKGESQTVQLSMEAQLDAFIPGKPYAAPAIKLWLYEALPSGKPGALCDEAMLLCGFPGKAPDSWLPLTRDDCILPPETLLERLTQMHITAVSLPAAATDAHYRLLTRAGIAARQTQETLPEDRARLMRFPCVTFEEAFSARAPEESDLVLSAWRLGGLITYPRAADPDMTPADLLRDAAGRSVSPADSAAQDVLAWLRAVAVRLRAEAIRQGRMHGPICAPGEWNQPDIAEAIKTAFAPLHLSALPLCGAWWTSARFSASLHAFLPEEYRADGPLRAEAVLEDAEGRELAHADFPCPAQGSALGLIEAALPEYPCVLELHTRLYASDALIEQGALPVYVGELGPLEAAF